MYAQAKALSWATLCQIIAPTFSLATVLLERAWGKAKKMIRGLKELSSEHKRKELGQFNTEKKRLWGALVVTRGLQELERDFLSGQIVIGHKE